jgi:hypothetical protein
MIFQLVTIKVHVAGAAVLAIPYNRTEILTVRTRSARNLVLQNGLIASGGHLAVSTFICVDAH